jgi:hypothetical protein
MTVAYGDAFMNLTINAEALASIMEAKCECDEQGTTRITLQKAIGLTTWATKTQFTMSKSSGGPWASKRSPEQDEAALLRWALHTHQKADAAITEVDAREWYTTHVKTDLVRTLLLMFTDLSWTTKEAAIQTLLGLGIGFVPPTLVKHYYYLLGTNLAGISTLVSSFLRAQGEPEAAQTAELARRSKQAADDANQAQMALAAAQLAMQNSGASATPPGTPDRHQHQGGSPVAEPLTPTFMATITEVLRQQQVTQQQMLSLLAATTSKERPQVPPTADADSRYARYIASLRAKVIVNEYVNMVDYCPEALRNAREKLCSSSTKKPTHTVVAGLQVVTEIQDPEFKSTDERHWLSGFDEYVQILSSEPMHDTAASGRHSALENKAIQHSQRVHSAEDHIRQRVHVQVPGPAECPKVVRQICE